MADAVQLQPLPWERVGEAADLRVAEHARRAGHAARPASCSVPAARGGEELVVRHRAPEEVRQPRGEFPVVDLGPLLAGRAFFEVVEVLRGEDADHRRSIRRAEVLARLEFALHDLEVAVDLRVGHRPSPGACGERFRRSRASARSPSLPGSARRVSSCRRRSGSALPFPPNRRSAVG